METEVMSFAERMETRREALVRDAIRDLLRSAAALDRDIAAEEAKSRVSDVNDVNYSLLARATRTRRENIMRTVETYRGQVPSGTAATAA